MQKLTKMKGEAGKPAIIVGGFNIPLSIIELVDRKSARARL